VEIRNMMIAGQFSGGRADEASADIEDSVKLYELILSGAAEDFRVIMTECEPPGTPGGVPGRFRECPTFKL
jgi:hypothetical protein